MAETTPPNSRRPDFLQLVGDIVGAGFQRYTIHLVLLAVALGAIWLTRSNIMGQVPSEVNLEAIAAIAEMTPTADVSLTEAASPATSGGAAAAALYSFTVSESTELTCETDIHTNIPTRPRTDVISYTVVAGDTLFGIADKFALEPETIVWGNPVLKDDPHLLRPDQVLRIPPVNGVLRDVQPSDKLEVLATFYQVTVDDIVSWPGNNLDPEQPALTVGQVLMVPGGRREFVQFVVPQIVKTRRNVLSSASNPGPGACGGGYSGGAVGSGYFIWPSLNRFLSGNNYWSGHQGIDIAAGTGDNIWAADSGVVVFAGWSNWGYGNMVAIDHGNGWQTLYAHLQWVGVQCGQSVLQGAGIGTAGSTGNSSGPHLHLELNINGVRPSPWSYLPAP